MKSLLIHSLLTGIPVNPIYVVEEENIIYPLDGSQRTSTCISYLNDEFALSKDTPTVTITSTVDGEQVVTEYEIAGKKFKKLDDEVKETLLACTLEFCTLSDTFGDMVYRLAHHPIMDKLVSKTQRKNGTDKDTIIQTLMLIATNQENDFTSFKAKDINTFVTDYADNYIDCNETLVDAMDKLDESFESLKIPTTSLPMILYASYKITKNKKSFSALVNKIIEFLDNYDSNEEYKQYVQSGTGSRENVRGRFEYWRNIVRELQ